MHRIRLIGPWQTTRIGDLIVLERKFNKPTGVTDQTKFLLSFVAAEKAVPVACLLNGVPISFREVGGMWSTENATIINGRNLWSIHFPPNTCPPDLLQTPIGPEHPLLCDAWLIINDSAG
jgi:hypothetical protein